MRPLLSACLAPLAFDSVVILTSAEYGVFPAGILIFLGTVICHVADREGAHVTPLELVLAPPPLVAFLAFLTFFFGTSLSSLLSASPSS